MSKFGFNICHNKTKILQLFVMKPVTLEQSFKVLATSDEPWAAKFREHLKNAHGLDITQTSIKINELLIDWEEIMILFLFIFFT